MTGKKNDVYSCPMCIREILQTLGISKMLLLKLQDPSSRLIKVNGYSLMIGKLITYHDDSDGEVLGFSGMNSCDHTLNVPTMNSLVPRYYLPA